MRLSRKCLHADYDKRRVWVRRWLLLQHFTAYKQHYRGLFCENKSEKSIFPLLCLTGELREKDGDTERRHRGERQDTLILRGFSPYITVRSTLQPPLEREHVVNTSSSGPVPAVWLHSYSLHENMQSKVPMLLCKMQKKKNWGYLSMPEMSPLFSSLIGLPSKSTTTDLCTTKQRKSS